MKDSGIEWIGEIPDKWEVKRGKELFHEINDRCETPDDYRLLSVSEYYGVAPKSEKIDDGDFETHAETLEGYKLCKEKDIVMNIMLAWKRATGISEYEGLISPAYCIYRSNGDLCEKYYHYLFRTDEYAGLFKQYSTGIIDSRLRLYPNKFLSLKYHFPPKETQQKIATYLDEKCSQIEQTIQNQQQVIEKLKAYKQSLITEAVTGKVKIQNGKVAGKYEQYKDSGVEWIGEIPSGWEVRKTKYVTTKITDGAHISPETENGIYDFISTTDVKTGFIDFEHCLKTSEKSYEYFVSTGCKPQRGDVLISKDGTVGKTVIITEDRDFVIASSLVILRPNFEVISSEFLNYALQSSIVQETLLMLMHGSGLKRVSVKKNSNLLILLPTINEQNSIVIYLDKTCAAIDSAIEQKEKLIEKLTEYKKSLIYECVTGKKDI